MRKTQADRQAEAARARQITEESVGKNSNVYTSSELAAAIRCPLFAKRDTLKEAMEVAIELNKGNPAAMTALFIVLNTLADNIETAAILEELGVR